MESVPESEVSKCQPMCGLQAQGSSLAKEERPPL
ncbi:MAG: hypothetical protein AW09_002189 [Candidatus Accumulibacter phosphatis]|uniref:Uncharacterized protein n=1 Tax=Candidatus Accumulibacter phosphatis TaxID=327160 RepID=A0A080LVI8_9PROT|nr:MAG: hypothetical protein AW09_002189 [Candidatus Accumulibacter phosphatis]